MQLGRIFGIAFLVIGLTLAFGAYYQIQESGSVMKLFLAGPALMGVGFGFIIFPGGSISTEESKSKTKDPKLVTGDAPMSHRIAWVIFGILGFIVGEYFLNFFGFFS